MSHKRLKQEKPTMGSPVLDGLSEMNYISSRIIPNDIWYIIAKFLTYNSFLSLDNTLFSDDSIVYKEYFYSEISGEDDNQHADVEMNYKARMETVMKYTKMFTGCNLVSYVCHHGFLNLYKEIIQKEGERVITYGDLQYAVSWGHLNIYKYVNENFQPLDSRQMHGLLATAISCGQIEIVKYMYEKNKIKLRNSDWSTLNTLLGRGYIDVLEFIVDQDPTLITNTGYNLCAAVVEYGHSFADRIDSDGNLLVLKFLLEFQPEKKSEQARYSMLSNMGSKDMKYIRFLIEENLYDIAANNYEALRRASDTDRLEMVEYLAGKGPAGLAANEYEPLMNAMIRGNTEIIKFLVNKDSKGIAARDYEVLKKAVMAENLDLIKFSIEKDPTGVAFVSKQLTGYRSARNNEVDKFFIAHGTDINIYSYRQIFEFKLLK